MQHFSESAKPATSARATSDKFGTTLSGYEPAYDGLRAVAVTAVVAFHASPWLPGGWAGVDVFFVLSGFLITALLTQEVTLRGEIGLRRFYARRALRLLPAFVTLLLFSLLVAALLSDRGAHVRAIAISAAYLMNWNRAFDLFPQAWLGHTWSLAMEEQFYLIWPCVLLLILPRRPLRWIAGLMVAVTAWRVWLIVSGAGPERAYNGFDTHSDGLLIGCGLALLPIGVGVQRWASRFVAVPVALAAVLFFRLPETTAFAQTAGLSLAALGSAWLIVAVPQPGWARRLLSLPSVAYTGRISYGWYLWHYPILLLGPAHLPHWPGQGTMLVGASYLAAVASYHGIERPFLRLKARFEPTRERAKEQRTLAGGPTVGGAKTADRRRIKAD